MILSVHLFDFVAFDTVGQIEKMNERVVLVLLEVFVKVKHLFNFLSLVCNPTCNLLHQLYQRFEKL